MCFTVLLATDSPADLSRHNGQGVLFQSAEPDEALAAKLPYPYVYDVAGDKEGCACCFNFYGPLITAATRFGTTAVSGSLQKARKKPHKNSAKHYTCWTLFAASSQTMQSAGCLRMERQLAATARIRTPSPCLKMCASNSPHKQPAP